MEIAFSVDRCSFDGRAAFHRDMGVSSAYGQAVNGAGIQLDPGPASADIDSGKTASQGHLGGTIDRNTVESGAEKAASQTGCLKDRGFGGRKPYNGRLAFCDQTNGIILFVYICIGDTELLTVTESVPPP